MRTHYLNSTAAEQHYATQAGLKRVPFVRFGTREIFTRGFVCPFMSFCVFTLLPVRANGGTSRTAVRNEDVQLLTAPFSGEKGVELIDARGKLFAHGDEVDTHTGVLSLGRR